MLDPDPCDPLGELMVLSLTLAVSTLFLVLLFGA